MDSKTLLVLLLIVLAVGIGYYVFFLQAKPVEPPLQKNVTLFDESVLFKNDTPVQATVFEAYLISAPELYLVEDLRRADSFTVRKSIQQCGIDFASSAALVNKNLTVYAFDDEKCTSLKGITSLPTCIDQMNGKALIYIRPGNRSIFYAHQLVVELGGTYIPNSCRINLVANNQTDTENKTINQLITDLGLNNS